jgi:hypothetical protein
MGCVIRGATKARNGAHRMSITEIHRISLLRYALGRLGLDIMLIFEGW